MDPLDIAEFDSLSKSEVKTDHAVNDDLDFVFVDKLALPASSPPKWSSAKGSDLLFSFDEGPAPPEGVKAPPPASFDGQDLFGGELRSPESRRDPFSVESDRRRADDEPQSDLFDDFWDLASVSVVPPRPADQLPEETPVPNVHGVSDVDLLFGVEVDQQASSIDVRVTNQPDILDFFDSSSAPDPVDRDKMEGDDIFNKMAYTDIEKDIFFKEDAVRKNDSTSTHLEKDISFQVNAFKESEGISSEVHAVKDCVDIAIDDADGKKIEEKTDDGDNDEQMGMSARHDEGQDKVDGIPSNGHDFDFSLLELPGTAHLNLDLSKHKRTLSQKGSIARRKRPTRAAILTSDNEDSMYVDSTEPKLMKTDDPDGCASSKVEKPDSPLPAEEDKSANDPSKRYGGVKIPGLLEGLSKTKVFAKNEPSETPKRPETKIPTPLGRSQAATENSQAAPQIKSKPLVLPRVLPSVLLKPTSKTQKETQNHSTASEASPAKPLHVSDNKLSAASHEQKDSKAPAIRRVLPSKPDLKPVTGHESAKTEAKVPPPVPSKPSMPVKPLRSSLLGSASFSTADRTGMIRKSALPPLTTHNGNLPGLDSTDSSSASVPSNPVVKTDSTSFLKAQVTAPFSVLRNELTTTTTTATAISRPESSKNVTVTRASSLRGPGTVGYTDRFKFKPRDSDIPVSSHTEAVNAASAINVINSNSTGASENCEPSDHQKENQVVARKSSISGISSVKSPSITDKTQANSGTRRGSFTGSAYNPIGFRPSVTSADGEEARSRSSSTSDEASGSKQGTAPVVKPAYEVANETESQKSLKTAESSHLTTNTANSVKEHKVVTNVEDKKKEAANEKKEAAKEEKKKEAVNEEKKKEAVNEANKILREQVKPTPVKPAVQRSVPDKSESAQDKASPWNVKLRKVEKKEKTPEPQPATQESTDSPSNWRQQLAQKRRSIAAPRGVPEPEKTKDSTPEWARASINRRQRLIDSGIISADGK